MLTMTQQGRRPTPTASPPDKADPPPPRLYLASQSPRRRQLLADAGYRFDLIDAQVDDGLLHSGDSGPEHWVTALAYLKAACACHHMISAGPTSQKPAHDSHQPIILGADTVCESDGQILGKPESDDHARDMIRSLRGGAHRVLSGIALIHAHNHRERRIICDAATVRVGHLPDNDIDEYVATGEWQGKAGGYNLFDRQAAGWPIDVTGDPTTVVGLPMRLLTQALRELNIHPASN